MVSRKFWVGSRYLLLLFLLFSSFRVGSMSYVLDSYVGSVQRSSDSYIGMEKEMCDIDRYGRSVFVDAALRYGFNVHSFPRAKMLVELEDRKSFNTCWSVYAVQILIESKDPHVCMNQESQRGWEKFNIGPKEAATSLVYQARKPSQKKHKHFRWPSWRELMHLSAEIGRRPWPPGLLDRQEPDVGLGL
ncbi:uncharacterized protein RSE6_10436 [Rhynchosporium secalis]|uniref:Uncharacterized protein n=1 Tax=Rhynchosporium secalis TaxID=38038 RepID=A0A1E1MKG6_RHYSE|nr:uncharacterized protein RSE6_10436 [Rhynchosporium secalis]